MVLLLAYADGVNPGDERRVLTSLTKYIPHDRIAHAGGQYAWSHYQALNGEFAVSAIAPDNEANRAAALQADAKLDCLLVRGSGLFGDGRMKFVGDIESAWSGSSIPWFIRAAVRRPSPSLKERLDAADVIEFQWSEMMALAPLLREAYPRTPFVGIAHDVITQRWERSARASRGRVSRGAFALAAARSRPRESRSFGALDVLITFSEKDAALVAELSPTTRVEVVHPGLGPREPLVRDETPSEPRVLFTGALDRPDNARAAEWFLEEIWPEVRRAVPQARFVIAGANPPASLQRMVQKADRAELTGFVDSLDPYYASASVFVAPLLTGAGVKFKTLDAMLRGTPVVSTSVGAEGIDAHDLFAGITDDAKEFALAVVAELRFPQRERTQRALQWAQGRYGLAAFGARLREIYQGLVA